ncbi:MAG: DUF927 domain-containing protein [Zoogloeaceae bacterium]|jgi:uncharacterized protein (DUF927 family)/phage/plasmid primase-like uncharacterized protein|nr:DUF927 domain-containing protein [Zoogloeaceae bacterium]
MNNAIDQFRDALVGRGIIPPDQIIADGELHRCDVEGKHGKGDAAYLLHLDGIPAGGFENHRDGLEWENWRADTGRTLTPDEEAAHRARIKAAQEKRQADGALRREKAQEEAARIWKAAKPCAEHAYLTQKGIAANGARLHEGRLVLPLRDTSGVLHSLQTIGADGGKLFLPGGKKQGCYFAIGKPGGILCIAEGFATGASIHETTGYAVAVAFDAGNLKPIAQALREKLPNVRIVLCADDDWKKGGNLGLTKAREAAQAVGGKVAVPVFGEGRADNDTDFNDMAAKHGADAVREAIDAALTDEPAASEEGKMPAKPDAPASKTPRFRIDAKGVFFVEDGNSYWICSPLHVVAMTRDAKSNAWGRLLRWKDRDGVSHQWAMPLEHLRGDGAEVWRELLHQGLVIAPGRRARERLADYLQTWPVKDRARCVDRLGWHGAVYVTPTETIGADELVVFQNTQSIEPALLVSGTVEEWRDSVAARGAGNSRLVFALSAGFAGALVHLVGEDSGGFHLRGESSSGKSTALKLAASVWGNPDVYPRLWRATANGLEGLAALHNDGLLILDELSQIDPREAGEAAYMLANGQGKSRANRTGAARQSARWRLLFISAGEVPLSTLMAQAGKCANAGQEIRMADIESDAGAGMGAFENLHDSPNSAAFAQTLKDATMKQHGAVGMAWLRCIVKDAAALPEMLNAGIRDFVKEVIPANTSGQVMRVARRFALVAAAGELATHYGLTGWQEDEADAAVKKCFTAWLEGFGGAGNKEERAMLSQVRAFFEAHGASRFESMDAIHEQRIINRAGFFRSGADGKLEFLVLPEAFKREVCQGLDSKTATKTLVQAGWIEPGKDGKFSRNIRVPGLNVMRCYVFTGRVWEGEA